MGVWGTIGRIGADIATGGGYEAYKYFYGDPANQQKAGYDAAGGASAQLGADQRDYENKQGQTALNYFSGPQAPTGPRPEVGQKPHWAGTTQAGHDAFAPAAQQTWDKQQADYQSALKNGPISPDQALINLTNNRPTQQQDYFNFMGDQAHKQTNQEQLYNERKGGYDPAAAYQDQRATENINKQLAARGRFNSGPGVRQISDYQANVDAQRSQQLAGLAGGADSSRLGMDTAYGGAARGASGEQSDYFGNVMDSSQKLAQAKADTFGHYSDRGSDAYQQGQLANIEAQLAKAGVDSATRQAMLHDIGEGLKMAGKAKGGGGGG
jgi:hypothetical protein